LFFGEGTISEELTVDAAGATSTLLGSRVGSDETVGWDDGAIMG
jgi:hypothetical protein